MSDDPPVGTLSRIGHALITALPPAFLLLLLINLVFLIALFWFEAHQAALRADIIADIVERCLGH